MTSGDGVWTAGDEPADRGFRLAGAFLNGYMAAGGQPTLELDETLTATMAILAEDLAGDGRTANAFAVGLADLAACLAGSFADRLDGIEAEDLAAEVIRRKTAGLSRRPPPPAKPRSDGNPPS